MTEQKEELPTFWLPEPIYAVKYYQHGNGFYASLHNGFVAEEGVWHTAECGSLIRHSMAMQMGGSLDCDGPPATRHVIRFPWTKDGMGLHDTHMLCGFYAYKRPVAKRKIRSDGDYSQPITNTLVQLAGRVIEHEKGYRAERQLIVRLLSEDEKETGVVPELEGNNV